MLDTIHVGLIGCGFMGRAHSNAWAQATKFFPHRIKPVMKMVCARKEGEVASFAKNWGWELSCTDWRRVVEDPDIDIIDICVPNNIHHDIVIAAAQAGKIIICEKPLALTISEAKEMVDAVEDNGKPNMICFNYRRVPAVTLAKQIISEGRLGRIFHYRAQYLQDWTINPDLPQGGNTLWRLDAKTAGNGVTGDLLAHSIDLALWLAGSIHRVNAMTETFIRERSLYNDPNTRMQVEIDDACAFLARFENGALGVFESTRYAAGRKNLNTFEINGEYGTIAFNFENAHLLTYYNREDDSSVRGFRNIQVWDSEHPYMKAWWVPGCAIGYEHTFIHAISDFLTSIETGEKLCPDLKDGYAVQLVCDAVLRSSRTESWEEINYTTID